MTSLAAATHFIRELRKRGCRFSLDDFGSGLSSFIFLKNLPVDFLKIDGQFMHNVAHDHIDRSMVEAITQIGQHDGHPHHRRAGRLGRGAARSWPRSASSTPRATTSRAAAGGRAAAAGRTAALTASAEPSPRSTSGPADGLHLSPPAGEVARCPGEGSARPRPFTSPACVEVARSAGEGLHARGWTPLAVNRHTRRFCAQPTSPRRGCCAHAAQR